MITIVSGFGRCGSSLVMQMLSAGGMPCAGEYPAFEPPQSGHHLGGGSIDAEWLATLDGHAVKILDPQNGTIPRVDCRIIWCSRNYHEQARSQAKFAAAFGMPVDRNTVRGFERSYKRDKPAAIRSLLRTGTTYGILDVPFEHVLSEPEKWAAFIAQHRGEQLNVAKMAAAVRARSPLCAPDLGMELALISERECQSAHLNALQAGKG